MSCNTYIRDSELLRAHNIAKHNVFGSFSRVPQCDSYRRFDVIDLKDDTQQSVLDREISWEFFNDCELVNRAGFGKIAKLGNIRIKQDKKLKGLGADLHAQHLDVLGTNKFKQIHLSAKWDGVIVWPTLFFKFSYPDQEDELLEHISVYMLDVLNYSSSKVKSIMDNYTNIKSLSIHLKPDNKDWFTKWFQETDRSLQFDMYKDIP